MQVALELHLSQAYFSEILHLALLNAVKKNRWLGTILPYKMKIAAVKQVGLSISGSGLLDLGSGPPVLGSGLPNLGSGLPNLGSEHPNLGSGLLPG